jgi:hypothetical protein
LSGSSFLPTSSLLVKISTPPQNTNEPEDEQIDIQEEERENTTTVIASQGEFSGSLIPNFIIPPSPTATTSKATEDQGKG